MTKKPKLQSLEHSDLQTVARLLAGKVKIMRPPPKRTADEWADASRILPPGSPEPGLWRTSRVPYTRDIYRAFSDPRYSTIVGVMGAQQSKTELIMNVIGHRFVDGPYVPTLYIGPTEKQVRSMSIDRFMKMLRTTPDLWERLAKGHANKVTEKWLGGIRLGFGWAGSATELASHPAGLVVVDERDRMTSDVGGEGDPVELARARGSNYYGFKIGIFSTPTIEHSSPTWSLYEEGTMMKWAWPCLHCNKYFVPRIELLIYDKSEDLQTVIESAIVACPYCGGTHESKHKTQLNENGKYLPHMLDSGNHIEIDEPRKLSTASFWVSGLCSPWQTFGQRAEQLVKAYASREPERIQSVINTAFGELYKQSGDAPSWEEVYATRSDLNQHELPDWSKLVTMGVDVQKDGLYYVTRAWGFNSRSHLMDHGFVYGDTESDDVWLMWQDILMQGINDRPLIAVAFVDSGYKPGHDSYRRPEHKVYDVCRRLRGLAFPTKGRDEMDRPIKASQIDVTVNGRTIKGGITLWHIHTDHIKSWVHAQINPPENSERLWTTHLQIDEDYCRQIVAEELIVKPSGKRLWLKPRHRANHYFDCEVLARAAAMSRQIHALQKPAEPTTPPEPKPPPAFTHSPPPHRHAPQQSFFQRYRK